jgi:excisionase family DNA binding protein
VDRSIITGSIDPDATYTTAEITKYVKGHRSTVQQWIRAKKLAAIGVDAERGALVKGSALIAWLEERARRNVYGDVGEDARATLLMIAAASVSQKSQAGLIYQLMSFTGSTTFRALLECGPDLINKWAIRTRRKWNGSRGNGRRSEIGKMRQALITIAAGRDLPVPPWLQKPVQSAEASRSSLTWWVGHPWESEVVALHGRVSGTSGPTARRTLCRFLTHFADARDTVPEANKLCAVSLGAAIVNLTIMRRAITTLLLSAQDFNRKRGRASEVHWSTLEHAADSFGVIFAAAAAGAS